MDDRDLGKKTIEGPSDRIYREIERAFRKATDKVIEAQRQDFAVKLEPWEFGRIERTLKIADEAEHSLIREMQRIIDKLIPQIYIAGRRGAFIRERLNLGGGHGKEKEESIQEESLEEETQIGDAISFLQEPLTPLERRKVKALSFFTFETYKTVAAEWHGKVRTAVALGVLRGEDMRTVSHRIREQTGVRLSDAERIARTEAARISHAARMSEYERRHVEKLDWIVGPSPCSECADLERGSPYNRERVPALPVHPNCKCAVAPVIEELR